MLDEHGYGQRKAHWHEAEAGFYPQGYGYEHHGPDGLALKHQARVHHEEGQDDIEHPERSAGADSHGVECRIDHGVGEVGGVEAASEDVGAGGEQHEVPGDIDIVPFHHTYSREQGENGADESHDCLVNIVEGAFGDPKYEHDHEDADGPPFLGAHFAHSVKFDLKTLYPTFDLWLLLLFLHGEENVHPKQQAYDEDYDAHGPDGYEPVGVSEVAAADESGNERDGKQVRTAAGVECVGPYVDLE